ncbi:MAG: PIG-L family deacetylase [Acidimicrobiales bacterium]
MATLLAFHAHPDDEAITTGGTIAKAVAEGHRVVLVFATGGEHGEVPEGVLAPGQTLAERRRLELARSAEALGVARVEHLGYVDSGMMGTPENDAPESFWRADVEEAAARLAALLAEERADVVTLYDERGNYGHPDHIQVHRVGRRAAELAGTPKVYEATVNRDHLRRLMTQAAATGLELPLDTDIDGLGVTEDHITTTVDVGPYVSAKRASLAAHSSQITDTSFFLTMPLPAFAAAFGTEWFIRVGGPTGPDGRPVREDDLFAGLAGLGA